MIRRLKVDVLKDLPAKQRCIVPVTIQKPQHIKQCKNIISQLNETRSSVSSLVGEEASEAHFEARKLLMQAYQASGVGKSQSVAEYVLDWLRGSSTKKVLVFAHHKEVLDTIEAAVSKHLKGVGHIRIDGSVPPIERASSVKKFQTKAEVRLGLLSVTAAGVGLTLTAASSVIFAELHWTPGVLAQAEDRCHRIGQTNAVNIMFCVCKDEDLSVDMSLWKMLGKKTSNLGRVIDGEKGVSMNAVDSENSAPSEQ
jgi:SWI/SNF-related matrix-associated actin-dependent regulator 1 of chromatin subfamily A